MIARRISTTLLLVTLAVSSLAAQAPVQSVPDVASYATAALNPTIAVVQAIRSGDTCRLKQVAISAAMANGAAFAVQHVVVSPRPCLGCAANGMPSQHAANSMIGVSSHWSYGVSFAVGTAELRTAAKRHTPGQVLAGLALGGLSEWAGRSLIRCRS